MIFKKLATGMLQSNCYIVGDNGEGVIIDPGAAEKEIIDTVNSVGLKIKYIILTHAHIDHIISVDKVRGVLGANVVVHEKDAEALGDDFYNGSYLFGASEKFNAADGLLKDGDVLEAGGLKFEIIHTPGHTPGGICIKTGNYLFTGDTLFRLSVGRTDLGNGNMSDLLDSLQNRLMTLDDEIIIYPGHGIQSTIGFERTNNPFLG